MAWYDEAIFYHIYPLGLTGAPMNNSYSAPVHRLQEVFPWIDHIRSIGCNAIYIGPLFESVGHGYETTDYMKLDSRLGTNADLTEFVRLCHEKGIRVILDGVFNHTGRDFFAFQDIKKNRENSRYLNWYCNVNFWGNNEYNDGFSYDNWGGYNLLVKLNQHNPEVKDYISNVIRFWVSEFDVDGIRLDAADVLDFEFMKTLRQVANEVKPDFWLMGEVIHGDYNRWVNEGTLHSVTNYHLHKALYSGHNDHNYFEIAHTVKRLYGMSQNQPGGLKLYNFVDNHDVERIFTKLFVKAHYLPTHILLYTLPGIPSIYYGSEFGIDGKKERGSDASLRPHLDLKQYEEAVACNAFTHLIAKLGKIRQTTPALSYGDYQELHLTTRQYIFARELDGQRIIVAVNNDNCDTTMRIPAGAAPAYKGLLDGEVLPAQDGFINIHLAFSSGEIYAPYYGEEDWAEKAVQQTSAPEPIVKPAAKPTMTMKPAEPEPVKAAEPKPEPHVKSEPQITPAPEVSKIETPAAPKSEGEYVDVSITLHKSYEEMSIEELQEAILSKMAKNGSVTQDMLRTVRENIYPDSLRNWVRSFR